jgi:hypothetical protein
MRYIRDLDRERGIIRKRSDRKASESSLELVCLKGKPFSVGWKHNRQVATTYPPVYDPRRDAKG